MNTERFMLRELDEAGIDYDASMYPIMVYPRTKAEAKAAEEIVGFYDMTLSCYMPGDKSEDKAAEFEVVV